MPQRKTPWSECAKASRKSAWTAGGSWAACSGLRWTPPPSRSVTLAGSFASWSPSLDREDRAEDRDSEGAADRSGERGGRGRDADVLGLDVVLHHEHEHLHHQADPDPDDEHVDGGDPGRGVDGQQREQVHADDEDRGAGDRERPVATDATDHAARRDRRDQETGHQGNHPQARLGRGQAVDELQVQREEHDRAEHRHPDREAHRVRDAEDPRTEQPKRDDRLGRLRLPPDERAQQRDARDAEARRSSSSPTRTGCRPTS